MSPAFSRTRARLLALGGAVLLALTGCGDKTAAVRFKVNSEPEGAYVLYQLSGTEAPCAGEWIYLGNTPLQGIHQFTREQLRPYQSQGDAARLHGPEKGLGRRGVL